MQLKAPDVLGARRVRRLAEECGKIFDGAASYGGEIALPMRVSQHVGSASGQASFAALRDAVCRGREPPPGALYDRLGPRLLTVSGMLICVGALALLFAVLDGAPGILPPVMLALALFGLGQGLFISPNNSAIMGAAPASLTGETGGLLNVMRCCGISVGGCHRLRAARLAARGPDRVRPQHAARPSTRIVVSEP
jgi:hypothetical protein